ncbi:M48 family metallopeptidase [Stakelama tenebrarum]|uniref:M48 family metalloprotease n=1 Tax=Stakelama tenebrarum TaxID=2711215 RepID=A0A6G6Y3P7_9SPHN|nr:M48 family metallopeptidase [Sphingosinithalassobacter tenebrarum]QIG79552.1 M48 family metalloprotease [Sphingosinithalassobacter tenebrarum]
MPDAEAIESVPESLRLPAVRQLTGPIRSLVAVALILLFLPQAGRASAQPVPQDRETADAVLADVGYRLTVAAAPYCSKRVHRPGFTIHDLSQYSRRSQDMIARRYGFRSEPLVLAVAQGSPAAAAGLQPGDAIMAIDDAPLAPREPGSHNSHARVARILDQIDAAASNGVLRLTVRRAEETRELRFALEPGCPTRFQIRSDDSIEARANGSYVEVNSGVFGFVGDTAELAALVAHELAHNVLSHRARLHADGEANDTGAIRATEIEADRLAVHILDRAGYPPEAAIAYLQRYDRHHGLDFLDSRTHPSEEARIAIVRAEIADIAAARARGEAPWPQFVPHPSENADVEPISDSQSR